MLPYLSRVSLWLAALAAGVSLFTPGRQGALLASFAMLALIGALVMRRFHLKVRAAPTPDAGESHALDDGAMLDIATVLTRTIGKAPSLADALRDVRDELVHELGAQEITLHEPPEAPHETLVVPERFPLGVAMKSGEVTGSSEAGFALPVSRGGQVIAMLALKGTALEVGTDALGRLLELVKAQLDALAQREAAGPAPLEESLARYAELAETMEDTLFVSNPERSHFEFLGSSAFDTYGVSREQFERRHGAILDHLLEDDVPLLAQRRELEMRGEPADITYRIQHPRKGLRWIRSRSRTRTLPDGTLRVYGLVSDVTRDREHEVELERARDDAEAASLAKSQFMANMSHEIRTPMNGILGMTELLLGTPLNDKQRRFAKAVYRSGESLLEIINDILDFSKIEAGKLELAPTDFSLRSVVEDTLELLAPRAHEKGLELSFYEAPGLPPSVHGDPLRLRQVLTNLIANAIKFTEHGEVVVELRPDDAPVPVAQEAPAGSVWLAFGVRDTGIGIDPEVLPRLFSAFTQANGGMSRRYGGTGLGLAISRQLIELMGGSITVQSSPGIGSHFLFRLPLRPAIGDSAVGELDGTELSGMRVLVVEDHETNRTVLENMLGAWGMDVTLAGDGQQALDILRGKTVFDTHYDLALVDMHMPRVDGVTFGRTLKVDGSHPDLKMILLSSVSSPDDVRAAQLAGFHRFVAKPVRKAELRQAILGVSAQRRDSVPLSPRLSGSVLVIEDNPVNQEVIGQMLRHLGLRVRVAAGAMQGLRALCEAHFDLVLMDIQMPGMDGVEALGWFRRGSGGRFEFVTPSHTPVIAVTANALGGDQDRFLALGFDDYLSKPFRQSQLLAMLIKRLSAKPAGPADGPPRGGGAPTGAWTLPAGTETVLDADALERLRELDPKGENQLLSRVITAFEASAARLLPQLQDARRAGDAAGIRHVAHTLKSSSASIGAMKLSQLCAEIEAKIRTDRLENVDARVEELSAEVEIVLQALKRLLDAST
ncbi:PAS domain-containing hybrid sensor histidine kinase/response regulator [Piscinibacter sp. XHJ-5]|uniref:PAS domain-containing hybrid sensor histidine kinase/response regulator n=1 Tax=Piscinibacter sp. XHJ-5 TaxID=3037797 RepID=UPI002452E4D9|nr:PAS domain-containing hybrid sensor histidine kinase/response regulator [Piscinibacter sp. XHJ-5]